MSVYVDDSVDYGYGAVKEVPYARQWCHLYADSLEELHEFASRIGMKQEWFQGLPDHKFPHYDLTKSRRTLAIRNGAIPTGKIDLDTYRRISALQ